MISKSHIQFSGRLAATLFLAAGLASAPAAWAQEPAQQAGYPTAGSPFAAPTLHLPALPVTQPITPNGKVVEDVIARVNDRIITRSEYERARQQLLDEAEQQHMSETDLDEQLHNLLRDMIDQQLLLSKGKELSITGDAETMRQLDDIRKHNHMDSMQALQKAAEQQGVSFEDFKQKIRNDVITQQVVRDEVGRHLNLTRSQEQTYYDAHKAEFAVPEQVHLSEILVPTADNATDAQIAEAQAKADALAAKLKAGANFADIARSSSGGPTASAGGDLGDFKRGTLGEVLEKATFHLPVGGYTAPIRTRQGFVILKVDSHQAAGVPPLDKVEPQVEQAMYIDALQPALRAYLTKARSQAYIQIKSGFTDAGAAKGETAPVYTAYKPPPIKKKTLRKQRMEEVHAERAKAALAAARAKNAEIAEERAAKTGKGGSVEDVKASRRHKREKIRREKIRYGQAPRKSLPAAASETAEQTTANPPIQGQTAGQALAPTQDISSISTGGDDTDTGTNPLEQTPAPEHKTRFTDRQRETKTKTDERRLAKAEVKSTQRPTEATAHEVADEKHQAAPLGLNGDTSKKKHKHTKGEAKERLQDKKAPAPTPAPAPTVNPALTDSPTNLAPATQPGPSADKSTLPPAATPAPGALPAGQPIPATTSADPHQPATTPEPPQPQ